MLQYVHTQYTQTMCTCIHNPLYIHLHLHTLHVTQHMYNYNYTHIHTSMMISMNQLKASVLLRSTMELLL